MWSECVAANTSIRQRLDTRQSRAGGQRQGEGGPLKYLDRGRGSRIVHECQKGRHDQRTSGPTNSWIRVKTSVRATQTSNNACATNIVTTMLKSSL